MSEPNGCPPPEGSRQDLAARPPMCLQPLMVPGPPAAPGNEEGGFLTVCKWITSASWTHSSVHPSPAAHHPLSCSFTPSPTHHSLPLIHIGTSQAPSSDPFIGPASYSGYHSDERSAQISTSLAWVPPGGTSPRAWPHLPAQSFPFSVVGPHKDPRGTHTCASNKGRSISAQEATFGQWNMEAMG